MPIIEEYLYSLGATVNAASFKKSGKAMDKFYKTLLKKDSEALAKMTKEQRDAYKLNQEQMSNSIGVISTAWNAFKTVLKESYEMLERIYDLSTKISNKIITPESMFVDKDIRDLQARLGIDSFEAQSVQYSLDVMGAELEDIPFFTPGQLTLFKDLSNTYQEGMRNISQADLEKFQDVTQNFQKVLAESKLKFQVMWMEAMIAAGPELEGLFNTIADSIGDFMEVFDGDALASFFKVIIWFVEGVASLITAPMDMLAGYERFKDTLFGDKEDKNTSLKGIGSGIMDMFKNVGSFVTSKNDNRRSEVNINSNAYFTGVGGAEQLGYQEDAFARDMAKYIAADLAGVIE